MNPKGGSRTVWVLTCIFAIIAFPETARLQTVDRSKPPVLGTPASLKLPPERSVLKLSGGDDVKLGEADFVRLCKAFFTEIEKKYL